jgi:putative ABC transport system permease protein
VDIKTAWVIQGIGHGHENLAAPGSAGQVLEKKGDVYVGNASVVEYQEVTPENEASFHFHGEMKDFPITAVIAVPGDDKAATILRGRYDLPDEPTQILSPRKEIRGLLDQIVTVKSYVVTAFVLVGATTLAVAALVFLLSLRLRRREIETFVKIGASKASIAGIVLSEVLLVLATSAVLAAALTALTSAFGSEAVRAIVR